MSTISLRLSESLHKKVRELARRDKVSINQFINTALAEKLSAMLTEEYLKQRAEAGDRDRFMKAMSEVADVEPDEFDKL